jgi:3-dehydroquinate synthase
MAYSATLAKQSGLLSADDHRRLLTLFSRAGLTIDHPQFDDEVLDRGTAAILKTRNGMLRLAVPNPLGSCTFINHVSAQDLRDALRVHKQIVKEYPRGGAGIEAYVDSSDTGYADNEMGKYQCGRGG